LRRRPRPKLGCGAEEEEEKKKKKKKLEIDLKSDLGRRNRVLSEYKSKVWNARKRAHTGVNISCHYFKWSGKLGNIC
jgi:hypothetical protein